MTLKDLLQVQLLVLVSLNLVECFIQFTYFILTWWAFKFSFYSRFFFLKCNLPFLVKVAIFGKIKYQFSKYCKIQTSRKRCCLTNWIIWLQLFSTVTLKKECVFNTVLAQTFTVQFLNIERKVFLAFQFLFLFLPVHTSFQQYLTSVLNWN